MARVRVPNCPKCGLPKNDKGRCPPCIRERARELHAERPRVPYKHAQRMFGINSNQALAIVSRPCEICGEAENRREVDHDHATGKVRGSLCRTCNVGLGSYKDNPVLLRLAALYLERHGADPLQISVLPKPEEYRYPRLGRPKTLTLEQRNYLIQGRALGKTYQELADDLGIAIATAWKYLNNAHRRAG